MNYIIYCAALITLSYAIYKVFLAKETFYNLNRGVLLAMIILSFTLPFITVPESISFKRLVIPETIVQLDQQPSSILSQKSTVNTTSIPTESTSTITVPENSFYTNISFDWKTILIYIYILGVLVFAVHFLIQLSVLLYRMIKYPTIEVDEYKIIETNKKHAPYSFWNRIFMNPSQYEPNTYLQILKHEQVHIKGKHSIDMLLVELLVMFQWFNPFAWLYRKAIDNNLEYLTDNNMLTIGEDKEVYQMNLLKVSTPNMPTGLATSYNQSFLKKRILMMNSKKSTAKSGWKYLIIIPLLAITVLSFNPVKPSTAMTNNDLESKDMILDIEKPAITTETDNDLTKGVWDAEVGGGKLCIMFRSAAPLQRNFWSITRCYDPEFFASFPTGDKQKLELTRDSGTLTFTGEFDGKIGDGRYTFSPNSDFLSALKKQGLYAKERDLVHCFLTDFDRKYLAYLKQENLGISQDNFEDIIHKSLPLDKLKMYRKELTKLGYTNYTMEEITKLNLFNADIDYIKFINKANGSQASLKQITKAKIHNLTPEFIKSYNNNGYGSLSLNEYLKLKIHNVSPDFIASFKKKGFTNISVKEAQNLKIHNVTPDFIEAYKKVGYNSITLKQAKDLKIHNVTPEYINSFKKMGYSNISLSEAKKLKIHNVTADLIKSYKKAGQKDLSLKDAIKLKIHNITPSQAKVATGYAESSTSHSGQSVQEIKQDPADFIKAFQALGYKNTDIDDIISLKIHNVTPEFIKKFNDAGYANIPLDKVVGLKIHNITPEFIQSFKKAGYKNISLDKATSLKIHNVSPDSAADYVALGYNTMSVDDLVSLKIHNVTPEYIKNFKKNRFGDLPLDDIMAFKIHNVTPEFVKSFEDLGYNNITADQAKSLKIHNVTPEFVKSLQANDKNVSLDQAIRIKIHF